MGPKEEINKNSKNEKNIPTPIEKDVVIKLNETEEKLFNDKTNPLLNIKAKGYYSIKENELTINKEFFSAEKRVKDVWRYELIKNGKEGYKLEILDHSECPFCRSNYNDKNPSNACSNICLLIIESPHKDEYCSGVELIPIAPAQKNTGTRIHNQLEEKINEFINHNPGVFTLDKYQLVICNPVQFQTSLHIILDKNFSSSLKNKVWRKIFTLELNANRSDSFINRFKGYKPKIIINSCTSELKIRVETQIKKQIKKQIHEKNSDINPNYLYTKKHPSYWNTSTKLIFKDLLINKKGRNKNDQK